MKPEHLGTVFFGAALVHSFLVTFFARRARRFKEGSAPEALFHLLSEVEVVFGFWAFLFLVLWAALEGAAGVIHYQESLNMTEPLFIFCVMVVASTRPVMALARNSLLFASRGVRKLFRFSEVTSQFLTLMILGPLLGSLITEPAAITITALLLYRMLQSSEITPGLQYGILGLLFVNISVGGSLTHFAAPPILIVARTWHWGTADVFLMLGEPALAAVVANTLLFTFIFRKKIAVALAPIGNTPWPVPAWVSVLHVLFLAGLVLTSHYPQVFIGLFLVFMGLVSVTRLYQDELKFKEALLVAFFLAGLIVFGPLQKWWLEPLLTSLGDKALFLGAAGLTAVTDNAALTFLGSQVEGLTELSKWALVSGALAGGGLSILANAPNPAGYSILKNKFPDSSLNALRLFKGALLPTLVALLCFYVKIFLIRA